jgi:alkanesulfonate monooxygenase SsuD/methylene tetrahydromethanopterin reductase-like flavin-dependent oxidoreductase (luciferase family)/hemerythrin-like domain-containing protein
LGALEHGEEGRTVGDYGHDLEFGLFPSPDARRVHETLELAQLADVAGLDLVTVQDHPYNARHLDTSTLLAVVAARTTNVRVAANVANLPLRPPVVLARSIATLDIISGGRAELGLGTGAFWDRVVAAGGERRSPKESVDALVEAIRIIRGVWGQDPDDPGARTVTVHGTHYRVVGLHSGPRPVHDVEIWVGAYKKRMLRVTARLADGWLPSLAYAPPSDLAALNARIDDEADRCGRGPQAIRRMYNVAGSFGRGTGFLEGSPDDWAQQLAELTLSEGMSTYILATDDPDDVRRWADEVAPAVRELVADERARRAASVSPEGRAAGAGIAAAGAEATADAHPLTVRATPDDGTRLTASMPWREDDRPTLEPPGAGRYTAHEQAVSQHLVDVHDHLRSELAQVREVVAKVRRGMTGAAAARSAVNTMAMRQNNWTLGAFCESYCRVVTGHHTLEDRSIFRHLRRADPALGPVLDRLEEEHHVIADVLEQVDEALVGLVATDGYGEEGEAALDEIQRTLDLLTDTLLSHLAYEERELLHPLARHGFG